MRRRSQECHPLRRIAVALTLALSAAAPSHSARLQAELSPNLSVLPEASEIEVRVSLEEADELQQFLLGIDYDRDLLEFVSATPLTSSAADGGGYERSSFGIDPSPALETGSGGSAGVLIAHTLSPSGEQLERSILFSDGRTTIPQADPRRGLFALRFLTRVEVSNSPQLVRVGVLDERLHAITGSQRLGLEALTATLPSSVVAIPEPTSSCLSGIALIVLIGVAARRTARSKVLRTV